jgi:hypothetical protein
VPISVAADQHRYNTSRETPARKGRMSSGMGLRRYLQKLSNQVLTVLVELTILSTSGFPERASKPWIAYP